jgi:acetone carboxylase gamma subunit
MTSGNMQIIISSYPGELSYMNTYLKQSIKELYVCDIHWSQYLDVLSGEIEKNLYIIYIKTQVMKQVLFSLCGHNFRFGSK